MSAPGWYPQNGQLRYWDGQQWTDRKRRSWTFNMGFVILAAVSALVTLAGTGFLVLGALGSGEAGGFVLAAAWFWWGSSGRWCGWRSALEHATTGSG